MMLWKKDGFGVRGGGFIVMGGEFSLGGPASAPGNQSVERISMFLDNDQENFRGECGKCS